MFPTAWMARRADIVRPGSGAHVSIQDHLRTRSAPRWHWTGSAIRSILQLVPADRQARAISLAEDIVARRFTFRSRHPLTLSPDEWAPRAVSCGWTWDLNRHHWFATLGFAYWYSGDTRFLHSFVEQSSDWMDQYLNRLGRIEWDTPFEVASRINAWLWAHFLFLPVPDWDPAHCDRLVRGLGMLAEYLDQTIEYHCPGNHLLLEAKALALCGEVFPEFIGAARWRQKGWRILEGELAKQICKDGVHAERSTMYHRIIAGELAELWLYCDRNHLPQAAALGQSVQQMALFQCWIDQGGDGGDLPLFGDAQKEDTYYRFSAPAACGSGSHALIMESTDHSYWLLGNGDWKGPSQARPTEKTPVGHAFPDGGYFVARSAWTADADVLVWDCGPMGYHLNRRHAHLDTLSFTLSVGGTPLLIDPGVREEDQAEDQSEKRLRSTRAHNTVCIDGEEQGILAQRREIWSPPRSELLLWATSEQCTVMSGRHDGYRRLREPVRHARTIVVMHGLYWLIVDCIEGSGEHLVEQRFHIVPGAQVAATHDGDGVQLTKGDVFLSLHWARGSAGVPKSAPPKIRVEPSLAELYCGRPEQSLIVTAERSGQAPFVVAVTASAPRHDVRAHYVGGPGQAGWLVVTGKGFEHQVYIECEGNGWPPLLPSGWTTNARFAVVRQFAGDEPADVLLPGLARVWGQNREYPGLAQEPGGVVGMRRIVLEPVG